MLIYDELKDGHILEKGEHILIYGIDYRVDKGCSGWFLLNEHGNNFEVFDKLGFNQEEKYEWAKRFKGTAHGDFPEFPNLEDLTKFVIDIIETPLYKVGDKVIIGEKEGDGTDYPYTFTKEMEEHEGKVFTIQSVDKAIIPIEGLKKYNGDIHIYHLVEDGEWLWHSSMFKGKAPKEADCPEPTYSEKCSKYTEKDPFDSMLEMDAENIYINTPKKPFKTTIVL